MNRAALVAICLATLSYLPIASAIKIPERSLSLSKQFIVYCDDDEVRHRVTSFVEETKENVLDALGERDRWKRPIIVRLTSASSAMPNQAPMSFTVFGSNQGIKIQIDVVVGRELPSTSLQTEIIRALLLELAYREGAGLQAGQRYNEPPSWLIEGIAQQIRRKVIGVDSGLFKTLIDVNRLPTIHEFLNAPAPIQDSASLNLYRAYSYSLLQILEDLPNGRACLARYVSDIPRSGKNPVDNLVSHFPVLAGSPDSLEKWWTLSMARLSTADDYEGYTPEETESRLTDLFVIKVPMRGEKEPQIFDIQEFKKYLKLVGARKELADRQYDFLQLEAKASPLFRPILSEYAEIADRISRGKTRGVTKKLAELEEYRKRVIDRMNEIADYLNWMEATQFGTRSESFDGYLRIAKEPELPRARRNDAITLYLDKVEKQMR